VKADADSWKAHIARYPDDPNEVNRGIHGLTGAMVKAAELGGAEPGDAVWNAAVADGRREALKTQLGAIAVSDPARAARMLDHFRDVAGVDYQPLAAQFRARKDQQLGEEGGERAAGPESVANIPGNFIADVKQSEGFTPRAKWDVKQYTNGYGTKALFPGETIDRAEADRRFNQEISNASAFVDKVAPGLDAGTRAALTSLTFNAGTDWAKSSLGDKIRANDITAAKASFLQYTKAGGATNDGLVARRQREAEWFGQPGLASAQSREEAYTRAQNDPQLRNNPVALTHAFATINQRFAGMETERQTVGHLIKDDESSILNSGVPSSDLNIERVGKVLGPQAATEFAVNRTIAQNFYAQTHDWSQLSAPEISDRVALLAPVPGSPGFAYAQNLQQQAAKAAGDMIKERFSDPAGAVEKLPEVMAAKRAVSPQDPSSNLAVVKARLLAQTRLGIPDDAQSPITKAEALTMTAPLRTMLPGQERQVLTQIGEKFQKMYGDDADRAFAYALHVHKVGVETAQVGARIMKKLGLGQPLSSAELNGADDDTELSAATEAIKATAPQPTARRGVNPGRVAAQGMRDEGQSPPVTVPPPAAAQKASVPESNAGPALVPDARDIIALRANPKLSTRFDQKYGAGKSKKILEAYPVGVPAAGPERQ
jgi:GH24 family phage-related lysozyme (muramidase)